MNRQGICMSFAAALVAVCVGCDKKDTTDNRGVTAPPPVAADNTAKNKTDRDTNAKTPLDQAENSADINITAEIRSEVMKIENLSTNGQNCKIITENGVVTLRGPVNSAAEKERIGTLASNVAGVTRVDNQLEVKTP